MDERPTGAATARSLPHPDWQPPYPAHSSKFGSDVRNPVIAYFGFQSSDERELQRPLRRMREFLSGSHAPDYLDYAFFDDLRGYRNEVIIAYWLVADAYDDWFAGSGYRDWIQDDARLTDLFGIWQETLRVPVERLETISGKNHQYGITQAASNKGTEVREHAYWGAMRHRLDVSASDPLQSPIVSLTAKKDRTVGKRIEIKTPENLAIIRSGQDWSGCKDMELSIYLEDVHPKLVEGMNYLRDNPIEAGCCACRFMTQRGADGVERMATFGFATFISLAHLEDWSKTHPTHLAIFNSFHRMIKKYADGRDLKLYHEVTVLDATNPDFVYVNCHEETGLLRWFDGTVRSAARAALDMATSD